MPLPSARQRRPQRWTMLRVARCTLALALITLAFGGCRDSVEPLTTVALVTVTPPTASIAVGESVQLTSATKTQGGTAALTVSVPVVFASVSAGYFYSCGVTTGGAAYCWGSNSY